MSGDGAKRLGEKLLVEVEVEAEDLSSVLKSLRELSHDTRVSKQNAFFGIPELDVLFPGPEPPTLELVSPPPTHHPSGAGKTSLLYLTIAYAILPANFAPSIVLEGQDAAVVLFDPLSHFSVARLAEVMLNLLISKIQGTGRDLDEATKATMRSLVRRSLLHVHIFRPQSWGSLISALRSLPDYLFDQTRHKSMHRRIHSIILEDIDAFTWSIRSSPSSSLASTTTSNLLSVASNNLTTQLTKLSTLFSCAKILTSHSMSPSAFRPVLPTSWPQGSAVTRLAIRRVEVLKFAPAISIEEAEAERLQRWEVVSRGRFECWKVGVGVRDGEGLVFRVRAGGVDVERDDER